MQIQLKRHDQSTFWALISARLFFYQGESSTLTTITDITERIAAQAATARRAAELATVAEVGTTITNILDPQEMLQTVTDLVKERFDFYHAHVYLIDPTGKQLELTVGAGEIGRQMVAEGWQISVDVGTSLVAQAVRERQGVIVNDVRSDPNWLPNDLLPETRAEMAIPVIVGDQVLGALDVQAREVDRFTDADINIMTTLAAQMAVALQNARTYAQTQQQAEYEALINQISQRIQSTTSVENALQVTVRELGRALGAKRANVKLGGRD
jgi:GAF domain-containing protein